MKKVITALAVALLLTGGLTMADAANFIQTHQEKFTTPKDGVSEGECTFNENGKTVRFASKRMDDGTYRLLCTGKKKIFTAKEYWRLQEYPFNDKDYPDFIITQFRDKDTGHFFYDISFILWGEMGKRELLVGFTDDRKTLNTYIDSSSFPMDRGDETMLFAKSGNLYLTMAPRALHHAVLPGYRLDWSDQDKWFGYTYLDDVQQDY